jgi:hypothetical protein
MNPNNPLKQFFRQPAIYMRLPSGGNFYTSGALDLPQNGEIPVYPMTAIDEITYRTPDALFNGQAVVTVIQSCLPNIKNAWAIPAMDVDAILTAIRIASYGHNLEFGTTCPECKDYSDRTVDLRTVLDGLKAPDYTQTVKQGDIEIFFQPMTYKNLTDNNRLQFDEQRILQSLPDDETPDVDKLNSLSEALKQITKITVQALSQSIKSIQVPGALVTEREFIEEWLQNCDRSLFNQVRDFIINIKSAAEFKPLSMKCPACQAEYQQSLTLDMTNFFGDAS